MPFHRSSTPTVFLLLVLTALLAASCGGGDEAKAKELPATARAPRDERLVEAQVAYERGQPDVARTLLNQAADVDPIDRAVLEARLSLAEADPIGALRSLSKAKERWPADGRVFAAEAELYAALGRLSGAEESLTLGLERAGEGAELARAKGILALSIPGGAEYGLAHLERALALDPNVPFAHHAGAQAHLLVGRMDMGRSAPEAALLHAREALAWDALDPEYRELEAEALAGLLRFDEALACFADLEAEGRPLGKRRARLHQQAATAALMAKDREGAVQHYLAARARGLSDEELGFGLNVLQEEAAAAVARGEERYEEAHFGEALTAFERALELDPGDLTARNHMGVVHFRMAAYERAARAWSIVVDEAARRGHELPEPVHLNLARALFLDDDLDGARAACERYLDASAEGVWAEDTRDLLVELEVATLKRDG